MSVPKALQQRIAALFIDPALPLGHPASLDAQTSLPTSDFPARSNAMVTCATTPAS